MNISSASRWLAVCFSILMLSPPVWAESVSQPLFPVIGMDAGGSLRLRYEWKQGFALGTPGAIDPQGYLLSQRRLHAKVHHGEQWVLFVKTFLVLMTVAGIAWGIYTLQGRYRVVNRRRLFRYIGSGLMFDLLCRPQLRSGFRVYGGESCCNE